MSVNSRVTEFYDNWVHEQVKIGINLRHQKIVKLLRRNGMRRNDHVLEIGCGIGPVTQLVAKYVRRGRILAVDISPKSIERARLNLRRYSNVTFQVSDMSEFYSEERFDLIILPDVLEHIPLELHAGMFRTLRSLLSDKGFMFIHIPDPCYQDWIREYHPEKLQVIDHSLHLEMLLESLKGADLYCSVLGTHKVFRKVADYQYLVLRPRVMYASIKDRNRYILFLSRLFARFF